MKNAQELKVGSVVEFRVNIMSDMKIREDGSFYFDLVGQDWVKKTVTKCNDKNIFFGKSYYSRNSIHENGNTKHMGARILSI